MHPSQRQCSQEAMKPESIACPVHVAGRYVKIF